MKQGVKHFAAGWKKISDLLFKTGKTIDNFQVCGKILSICKDYEQTKQSMAYLSERGAVKAPYKHVCPPLAPSPGTTGTGAPVTEQLRCPLADQLGWYRD